ncbi:TetR/AcrR family transcriptional regulator [Thermoleophilia bacterium SCSIO 60948]|nr:TetR/AcrR family transcriptional regulator [Thermoleophilia bacterium SCSIO 60948]
MEEATQTERTERLYGGRTAGERRSLRHDQLVEAGLRVFAAEGWAGSTVLDVCRAAGLSQRYFYEAFEDREALFEAVVHGIEDEVRATIAASFAGASDLGPRARVATALGAIADLFIADPDKARVAMVESMSTARFRQRRERSLASFASLAAEQLRELADPSVDQRAIETASFVLVGGVAETLVASVTGRLGKGRDELVDQTTRLFLAAAGIPPDASDPSPNPTD